MNYELALALKNAGFPQAGGGKWIGSPQKIVWRHDDRAYCPTLEELIDACKPTFYSLTDYRVRLLSGRALAHSALRWSNIRMIM